MNAKAIIIATGARARSIPGVQIDGKWVLNYRAALEMTDLPPRMIVVGAGAIGMEFAYLWNIYGSAVAVVEMLPNVLPLEDEDISKEVEKQFIKKGIRVLTSIRVEGVSLGKNGVEVSVRKEDVAETLQADKVLIATGIAPNSEDLGIERVGLATEHGFIKIDEHMATNVKGIYAIGDVTGKLALAHVASAQGIVAAEFIAGEESHSLRYQNMPRCTYCHPEVSSIGLTERQARVQGYDVKVGNFPFRANGKALALNDYEGFAKIVADGKYGELLGVHIVGPHVTELIAGPTGLISLESTVEELARTIHPHPTLSETVSEAALAVLGASIHI